MRGHRIINFITAQVFSEFSEASAFVNDTYLDPRHLGKIFQHLERHRLAETGVVRPARINPSRCRGLKIGPAFPDGPCHWQPP